MTVDRTEINRWTIIVISTISAVIIFQPAVCSRESAEELPSISEFTAGMKKFEGFFNYYWDKDNGSAWLEIDRWNKEFLYVTFLSRGIGSNDIGADRGQMSRSKIVAFTRIGRKALLIQPNYQFRAVSGSSGECRSVDESFARSVIWGMTIVAEEDGAVLADMNHFLLADVNDIIGRLEDAGQGVYTVDKHRCAVDISRTKNFPRNSEFEVIITYQGRPEGDWIRSVTPSPESLTVNQHHSFVQLPDDGYTPRKFDPRCGYHGIEYYDYSTPFDESLVQRFISRHRLIKKNSSAIKSEPVEPIIYYIDPGIPEPVRSAVMEGVSWWNEAFEAAGFIDAFQVELLPEGADPLDARYNIVQWVHRSTRGWSYGNSLVDPRTGEIIKGHISLGSLRVRQDYLIAIALTSPYADGENAPDELKEMALARIRQLAAHEVGHAIGLVHNYASSYNNRASVMDYPHPLITLDEDGNIDFSHAYGTGIGEWDKVTIQYGYSDFPEGTVVDEVMVGLLDTAFSQGMKYITDADARAAGGAHPIAHLWDNAINAAEELDRVMTVRKRGLELFSENSIRNGRPLSELEHVLVPLYYFHRFQTEAAVKLIGGLDYTYSIRGDGHMLTQILDGDIQRNALKAVLGTLDADALTLPERILKLIPPPAPRYPRDRESFPGRTGVTFDPVVGAEAAADMTLSLLLHPERAARLVQYHARQESSPSLQEVLEAVLAATWFSDHGSGLRAEVAMAIDWVALRRIMNLAASPDAGDAVREITISVLGSVNKRIVEEILPSSSGRMVAHFALALRDIERFEKSPGEFRLPNLPVIPPGSPIGEDNTPYFQ
jgi:hypothetical protein